MPASSSKTVLFDYWRSSASYRVRIALYLAGIPFETVAVNLATGEQNRPAHLERNPQGFVPVLEIDGHRFTQSLAIVEYLDSTRELGLWPETPAMRARVTAIVSAIATDTHPVCNLSVVKLARGDDMPARAKWMRHFIRKGLDVVEMLLQRFLKSRYAVGDHPGIIDICLIPQLYNAHRWQVDYRHLQRISKNFDASQNHAAFLRARPEKP